MKDFGSGSIRTRRTRAPIDRAFSSARVRIDRRSYGVRGEDRSGRGLAPRFRPPKSPPPLDRSAAFSRTRKLRASASEASLSFARATPRGSPRLPERSSPPSSVARTPPRSLRASPERQALAHARTLRQTWEASSASRPPIRPRTAAPRRRASAPSSTCPTAPGRATSSITVRARPSRDVLDAPSRLSRHRVPPRGPSHPPSVGRRSDRRRTPRPRAAPPLAAASRPPSRASSEPPHDPRAHNLPVPVPQA